MQLNRKERRAGFSLVELVIVIVIIGVIAAIAIPRVTRATKGAGDSALSSNLAVLRNAIEMYASEHGGTYPGANKATDGSAGGAPADFEDQLLMYTNLKGETNADWDKDYPFGPYLRKGIPPLPVGTTLRNNNSVKFDSDAEPTADDTGAGWVFSPSSGEIVANCTETDDQGKGYDAY